MKKLHIFFTACLLLSFNSVLNAQPPTPVGPGAPASPIDDYLFLLIPLAVVMIIYFAKKYRKQLN